MYSFNNLLTSAINFCSVGPERSYSGIIESYLEATNFNKRLTKLPILFNNSLLLRAIKSFQVKALSFDSGLLINK